MPSIKKVAEVAGVSVGTVSHVITGAAPVGAELRAKVESAIRLLNYHPNHIARSLKTSRTLTLGMIVPDLTIPFFPQVIRGAEAAARQNEYSLIAVNSNDDVQRQMELLSLLRSQRVEGILLVNAADPTPLGEISRIIDAGIPIVGLDRTLDISVDSVSVDNQQAAEFGVNHLIGMGYRHIAVVTGPQTLHNERKRLHGYCCALEGAGLRVDDVLIWSGNLRPADVMELCRERLRQSRQRPDAIFCTNGPGGLGVLRALRECGLRTPEDIGFVTFDELTVPDVFTPSLTTVVQPAYDIGFRAAETLLERINGIAPEGAISIRLPAHLEVRVSSQPPWLVTLHKRSSSTRP
jgi:DNA-binding LacI/PurR family transcriptional regulator